MGAPIAGCVCPCVARCYCACFFRVCMVAFRMRAHAWELCRRAWPRRVCGHACALAALCALAHTARPCRPSRAARALPRGASASPRTLEAWCWSRRRACMTSTRMHSHSVRTHTHTNTHNTRAHARTAGAAPVDDSVPVALRVQVHPAHGLPVTLPVNHSGVSRVSWV